MPPSGANPVFTSSEIVFALGQLAAEMPYSLLCAVVFFVLLYYPMGLNQESSRAGYQVCSALLAAVLCC